MAAALGALGGATAVASRLASSGSASTAFSGARLEAGRVAVLPSRRTLVVAAAAAPAAAPPAGSIRGPMNLKSVGLLGHKAGMTTIFDPAGLAIPVTVISIGDGNIVTQASGSAPRGPGVVARVGRET